MGQARKSVSLMPDLTKLSSLGVMAVLLPLKPVSA
jgi:hypothetical protein